MAAVDFARDIEPVLRERCQGCHGARTQMSGLRLDNRAGALKGGNSGAVLVPGKSAESRLLLLVSGKDKKVMPPAGPRLTTAEVDRLREWIDAGAVWPESAGAAAGGKDEAKCACLPWCEKRTQLVTKHSSRGLYRASPERAC